MGDLDKKKEYTLPIQWNYSNEGLEAVEKMSMAIRSSGRHGLVGGIPILCQANECPYIDTCPMATLGVDVENLRGQRCPEEVSKIIHKFEDYVDHFDVDLESVDQVVVGLIKELIDYEIQIERADKIMAKQGDFLENVVVGISSEGRPIVNREIAKPIDYKERAIKKKHDILQLLNSTPKDKAGQKLQITMDPSTYASQLLARARELEDFEIIDVETIEKADEE